MNHKQSVSELWNHIDRQNWDALPAYFTDSAVINWHNTNECFSVPEFVLANGAYPGKWRIAVEKLLSFDDTVISVVKATLQEGDVAFHAVSFFQFAGDKITLLDEYWGDDAAPPQWRAEMRIGKSIGSYASLKQGDTIQLRGYDWRVLDVRDGKALIISDIIIGRRAYGDIRQYLDELAVGELFLLSVEEVVQYFGDSGQLAAGAMYIDDAFNSARVAMDADSGAPAWWWLRADDSADNLAVCVGDDGAIYMRGHGITLDAAGEGGVRPALWREVEL
ncbi:MAG: nuclear transport factor 2 family protein [Clostridiales bacterium]|nr:nuclear transport factor 2 family protein [Clostridiales bacterium]